MSNNKDFIEIIEILSSKMEEIEIRVIEKSEFSKLTHKQIYYLFVIDEMHNPTLTELAQRLDLSKPSVTAIVTRLIDAGYITKVQSDEDHRCAHLHMTRHGSKISRIHDQIHQIIAEYLIKNLTSAEKKQFLAILNRVVGSE